MYVKCDFDGRNASFANLRGHHDISTVINSFEKKSFSYFFRNVFNQDTQINALIYLQSCQVIPT